MKTLRFSMLVLTAGFATAAGAQSSSAGLLDLRVGKLEKEVRAVQRVVFPQGVPVQPDLSAIPSQATAAGNAASAPIADLNARVDAVEKQVAALTGTSEQNAYRLKQLEAAQAALQGRIAALEGQDASTAGSAGVGEAESGSTTRETRVAQGVRRPAGTPSTTSAAAKPATVKPDPTRKSAVAAIEVPSTGDEAEDDYTYGFRLYDAKFYPEAATKLKDFVAKYPPSNRRWSYAQNLLGRAYYDDGKPALASVAFYDNYQKAPQGERVVDSLTWLGQALVKLKKPTDACKVYRVLTEDYSGKLTGEQRARATKGRADAKCTD